MRTAILWTGGKDSTLALYRAWDAGADVEALVTFVPASPDFRAHPLEEMRQQADMLRVMHETISVHEPYRESYIKGLQSLEARGISRIVTGDIDYVDGHPNWIRECARGLNLEVWLPLWQQSREALLRELIERRIVAEITHIEDARIPLEWLHRPLDAQLVDELSQLALTTSIDLCGENGEYHTMVRRFPPRSPQTTD